MLTDTIFKAKAFIKICIYLALLIPILESSANAGSAFSAGASPEVRMTRQLELLNEEIEKKGYTHKVGPNPALTQTIEELCGLVPPIGWQRLAPWYEPRKEKLMLLEQALPPFFDWRSQLSSFPPVRSQGSCGSCWAFSTVAPFEFNLYREGQGPADLSEQYLLSCNPWGWNCSDGGWFAHDLHVDPGAVSETSFRYVAYDAACPEAANPPQRLDHPYHLAGWGYIGNGYDVPNPDQIKQAIYEFGPVAAAVCAGRQFQAYVGGVFNADETASCGGPGGVNHGIVLVGWDDNAYCGEGKYGAWILRNSWGSGWGEGGYMRICYGTSGVGFAANFILYDGGNRVYDINVQLAGTGSGYVTSSPSGINCGLDCTSTYEKDTAVSFSAFANDASVFLGWEGGACSGTGTCNAIVTGPIELTALFTSSVVTGLIGSYYNNILGRTTEAGADIIWAKEIERIFSLGIDISEGFIALAKLFFNSPEYIGYNKTPADYISDLYHTFFGREPDEGGLTFWTDLLQRGVSRNTIMTYFAYSDEFKAYMQTILGPDPTRPEGNLINDLYRGFMTRLPDDEGFQYWLGRMRSAQCEGPNAIKALCNEIAFLFTHSSEYIAKNRTDNEYVEDLYNGIMRRSAFNPDEYTFWLDKIATGKLTRDAVLQEFINSPEFLNRVNNVIAAGCYND
jgi:hypothetical protein